MTERQGADRTPPGAAPLLIGVLVTYRRPAELESTISALANQSRPPDYLLVVDNDPERSAERIAAAHEYLPSGDNLGPAGGLAIGVAAALRRAREDDWIILLDDDDPPAAHDELERLMALAQAADADVGGVGLVGARYSRLRGQVVRVPDTDLTGLVEVDCIGGGQLPLYRASALTTVSLSSELFFGFDDLDLGLRLRAKEWRLLVDGEMWVERRRTAGRMGLSANAIRATSTPPAWRRYYSNRNLVLIARRWGAWTAPLISCFYGVARSVRSYRDGRKEGTYALRGVVDGILGRSGRRVEPGY